MKNHIAEELPARKHAPAAAPAAKGGGKPDSGKPGDEKGGKDAKSPEARVRQAVYDIRYRARREEVSLQQAYSQYMQHSNMSQQEKTLVKQKLFGKGGMQAEDFQIEDFAYNNVANALYKVFVEGVEQEEPIVLTYMEKLETSEERKYKVRVTGKDKRSYVRYATRQKISELRANPNIESVEMTEYGEPYEGEKKRGEETARVKAGKDYDGDGKVESGAKEYRGAVHNAIQRKKGGVPDGKDTSNVKEEFIDEVKKDKKKDKDKPVDTMKGCNEVVIGPDVPGSTRDGKNIPLQMAHYDMDGPFIVEKATSKSHTRFIEMVNEKMNLATASMGDVVKDFQSSNAPQFKGKSPEKRQEMAVAAKLSAERQMKEDCGCDDEPKTDSASPCEDDPRSIKTRMNLAKNKLRAMGLKMSYEPEGELVDEGEFISLGREDRNRGRNSNMGSPTPQQREEEKARAKKTADRAKAKLRRGNYGMVPR